MAACNRKIDDRKIAKNEERAERVVAGIMVHLPQRQIPDIGQLVAFLIQIGDMGYAGLLFEREARLTNGNWGWLLGLNPMTGVVEGFRWPMLGSGD
jgi:ABC-type polysaccharide/polyol phosphate export permease